MSYATLSPPSFFFIRQLSHYLWSGLVSLARKRSLLAFERGILTGRLEVHEAQQPVRVFGDPCASHNWNKETEVAHSAVIKVIDENFWVRLWVSYDIGFAEAYMASEFETPDLKTILQLYIDNLETMKQLASPLYRLLDAFIVICLRFFAHGKAESVKNVAIYNTSNDLYKAFLSKEMMYSCPVWGPEEGGVRGDLEGRRAPNDLEAAQDRKIKTLLAKAHVRPGDRVLEIGCGWGAIAIAAARMGCTVDAITISVEQATFAQERVKLEGLEGQVRIHILDYRDLPAEFEKAFDACISTEMLEAVGERFMKTYIRVIDWALKSERATAVLTGASYPEPTYTPYQSNDFVRKYHWKDGVSPSPTSFLNVIQAAVPGRFCLDGVEDFGPNYPRCLREWARRLEENWSKSLVASLENSYPALSHPANMEVFLRKWRYMFIYMEVGYGRRWVNLSCWSFSRPGRDPQMCI